jgi:hypothetical protein
VTRAEPPPNQDGSDDVLLWTGDRLFTWPGGRHSLFRNDDPNAWWYDPEIDEWSPIRCSPPKQEAAVWTGEHVIAWGSDADCVVNPDGWIYTPEDE